MYIHILTVNPCCNLRGIKTNIKPIIQNCANKIRGLILYSKLTKLAVNKIKHHLFLIATLIKAALAQGEYLKLKLFL